MLLTPTNTTSVPFSREVAEMLKECDDVYPFAEAGSYFVSGFKDGNRKVYAHFSSKDAYASFCSNDPEPSPQEVYEAYMNPRR